MTGSELLLSPKIIILDRDGVINEDSPSYIKSELEWVPIPGSIEAIVRLTQSGYMVFIVTNQSGIARGLLDEATLARIHYKLCSMVEAAGGKVEGIFFCPHSPDANCDCRKPATGLIKQIESSLQLSLKECYFIGDSDKDLQAAIAHGCIPVLVRTGNGRATEGGLSLQQGARIAVFDDLADAVENLFFRSHDN